MESISRAIHKCQGLSSGVDSICYWVLLEEL